MSVLEGGYGCDRRAQSAGVNFSKPGSFGIPASSSSSSSSSGPSSSEGGGGAAGTLSDSEGAGVESSGEGGGVGGSSSSSYMASPNARDALDRRHLAEASCAHLRALVDPYGHSPHGP